MLSATAKDGFGIIERRKVEERRHGFLGRRNNGTARIGNCVEDTIIKILIAVADLVLPVLQQSLEFLGVFVDGVGEIVEVKGQHLGIGKAHNHRAYGLGKRTAIDEILIGKMRVPIEIIVDGVVDSSLVFAAIADIQGRNSQVIDKS